MKKLLNKLELKKINKLACDPDAVLITEGNELKQIYNKRTKKHYVTNNCYVTYK